MRIRKVEKNFVMLDGTENEPVSQLHKCAFQMLDDETTYLSLHTDEIIQKKAELPEPHRHSIQEVSAWTIISSETVEYRFYEAMGPVSTQVTPIPIVTGLNMEASETQAAYIELTGSNFLTMHEVWLGSNKIVTEVMSKDMIHCVLPLLKELDCQEPSAKVDRSGDSIRYSFPLMLVRHDGVIYPTAHSIEYGTPANLSHHHDSVLSALPLIPPDGRTT